MMRSLLIANRGEIACRIIRTARAMGMRTIAIYSDADAGALHVRVANEAVHIGPSPASESYLAADRIIAAAQQAGAEAIHPGYGFLAENAAFAERVAGAGLIWVGPHPDSILHMGAKDKAKQLMQQAGVPVVPGYLGEDQSPARLQAEASAIGYPVLIKAVAGGGGKGMRQVETSAAFADALIACRHEAMSSFGDDRVIIEKHIACARHIEVQVFGDHHGNVVHLFERDCSLQRRHQKVIEEAPAPGMDEATRAWLCATAVQAAKAIGYVGAGTIEFIADTSAGLRADRIWFMEMNTRLQVEHPVTEAITGVDLVAWQLRVAAGEELPLRQDQLSINGWAIEGRIYAEDPRNDFLPSTGKMEIFHPGYGFMRFDAGYEAGDTIPPYYDPLIGKVIAHQRDREAAIENFASQLEDALIVPVKTNIGLLVRILRHEAFIHGMIDTGFIARHLDDLVPGAFPHPDALSRGVERLLPPDMDEDNGTRGLMGFRLNAPPQEEVVLWVDGVAKSVRLDRAGLVDYHALTTDISTTDLWLIDQGQPYRVSTRANSETAMIVENGNIVAPMPGRIITIHVAVNEPVIQGQKLITLEAMKMAHSLVAPFDGIVTACNVVTGMQVDAGASLISISVLP
ncbi:acetyl/propionyl/methylcrotonyl-CoA carboxylase subunit alpha [Aquisediminimonas sediminicola]|uniref:acetyl/propionyl/methylcrotonyl-CoA carboxylase subunit alpha n=1 Tax=Alteraquisediminimonas sediminicola TaxID=2676787 RepID=UPI001C8D8AE1|nr:biotin carboxylase N-terminal domain-containing protein [Aquisediminimonas sediminicola]